MHVQHKVMMLSRPGPLSFLCEGLAHGSIHVYLAHVCKGNIISRVTSLGYIWGGGVDNKSHMSVPHPFV